MTYCAFGLPHAISYVHRCRVSTPLTPLLIPRAVHVRRRIPTDATRPADRHTAPSQHTTSHLHQHNTSSPPNGARRYDGPCRRNRQRNSETVWRGATKQATRCGTSPFLFPIYWLVDTRRGRISSDALGLGAFLAWWQFKFGDFGKVTGQTYIPRT
jgi:hypothetical protein